MSLGFGRKAEKKGRQPPDCPPFQKDL